MGTHAYLRNLKKLTHDLQGMQWAENGTKTPLGQLQIMAESKQTPQDKGFLNFLC